MKNDRVYRNANLRIVKRSESTDGYFVEGYASTFEPYVLFEVNGVKYSEQIDRHAFDETDMSDCVFRIDHGGRVYARTSNGLIKLSVDDKGLFNRTDLGATDAAIGVYDDIAVGNYPKMSFAFSIKEDAYDRETHTRTILKISKLYDISAVAFPANPGTSLDVSTRDYFDGVIEMEKAERLREETERNKREALIRRLEALRKD